jgi:iron complex transport system permease protein
MGNNIEPIRKKILKINLLSLAIVLCSLCISLIVGSSTSSLKEIIEAVFFRKNENLSDIIIQIRLPRTLLAFFVGGGLSICGAVFQSLLINPLAEPYVLGISSGSAFGATLALALGFSFFTSQVFALAGALIVMALVFFVGKRYGELEPNALLLGGVMTGAFFSAMILIMMTSATDSFKNAIFWLMGNLSIARYDYLYYLVPIELLSLTFFILNSYKCNLIALGTINAKSLGVDSRKLKNYSYFFASLLTASIVSISGIIGFVGLIIPHMCRWLFGYDNRISFPSSFLLGGAFLMLCDAFSRAIISPAELPVGAVTASLGAPVFIYILRKRLKSSEF